MIQEWANFGQVAGDASGVCGLKPHLQPDSIWPVIPERTQPMSTAKSKISGADSPSVTAAL
jgi:hypothetical protein